MTAVVAAKVRLAIADDFTRQLFVQALERVLTVTGAGTFNVSVLTHIAREARTARAHKPAHLVKTLGVVETGSGVAVLQQCLAVLARVASLALALVVELTG
jgi:hypothetical protein